jgi:hypothetical protein
VAAGAHALNMIAINSRIDSNLRDIVSFSLKHGFEMKKPLALEQGATDRSTGKMRPAASTPLRRGLWSAVGAGDLAG